MHFWKFLYLILTILLVGCNNRINFTTEEEDYIKNHTVTWSAGENRHPYVYLSREGVPLGISVEYMELISRKTGLKFQMINHGILAEELEQLKHKNVEMITSVRPTPERAEYALFTRPYIFIDTVMLKRTNYPKSVGIGKAYAVRSYLEVARKDLEIREFIDDEQSFLAMNSGKIDAVVMDSLNARSLLNKYRMKYDTVSVPYEYPLCFATGKDNAILRSIIDKALTHITQEEHEAIRRKWM